MNKSFASAPYYYQNWLGRDKARISIIFLICLYLCNLVTLKLPTSNNGIFAKTGNNNYLTMSRVAKKRIDLLVTSWYEKIIKQLISNLIQNRFFRLFVVLNNFHCRDIVANVSCSEVTRTILISDIHITKNNTVQIVRVPCACEAIAARCEPSCVGHWSASAPHNEMQRASRCGAGAALTRRRLLFFAHFFRPFDSLEYSVNETMLANKKMYPKRTFIAVRQKYLGLLLELRPFFWLNLFITHF